MQQRRVHTIRPFSVVDTMKISDNVKNNVRDPAGTEIDQETLSVISAVPVQCFTC